MVSGGRAVRVGGDVSGIVSAGDNAVNQQVTVMPPEALRPLAAVAPPAGLRRLPDRADLFVGRRDALSRLKGGLAGDRGSVVVHAVHGLGGIGKSALAARYAADCGLNPIWWLTADTSAHIEAGLADLAVALQPGLSTVLPLDLLAEQAIHWLASHTGWLVVLDNVTKPGDIKSLIGSAPTGRFLITSRRATGWHGIATSIRLDVLEPGEAVEQLTRIVGHCGPRDLNGAEDLCVELGMLPLGIEQAGAYIAESGITPLEYLRLLAEAPSVMFAETAEGGDAAKTVARTWRVTLDHLAGEASAGDLLRILAWYGPDRIPREVLEPLADPVVLLRGIGRLAAYSMVTIEGGFLKVHRLVQAVARTPDSDDPHRSPGLIEEARDLATALLALSLPSGDPRSEPAIWSAWRQLLPQIEALAAHTALETETERIGHLLTRAGIFLLSQGAIARASAHLSRARGIYERVLGADHRDTLSACNNLAGAYYEAGNFGDAIPLFEQALMGQERVLGASNPGTLATRNNLANAYKAAGNPKRAIPVFERAIVGQERVLGADHPHTLISRNSLAVACQAAGDMARAIPLYVQTLADRERLLETDHPHTLTSRNNLAYAYATAGDLKRAIPLYERTLADRERLLGTDHPDTLTSRNNLASAYLEAGSLEQAIQLFEQALSDCEQVLGADHPDTLSTLSNLACAYTTAGDLKRAIPLYERTLADRERLLGADHPDALSSLSNLARAYVRAGDLERAVPLLRRALADCERALGSDDPLTSEIRTNLARVTR
jgi:tetratricopeptide (TPR) repeat protein